MRLAGQVRRYLRKALDVRHRLRKLAKTPPLASLSGYQLSDLPHDFVAGLIIAALSIPIAMGYAQIAGLSPVYGLYASILPAIVFALVTNTRSIVFGMDSAAVAVTGGVIASAGVALGSNEAFMLMPMLTALVAAFLLLFAFTNAGKLVHYVPEPVMKGFILGISITIILHQVPQMTGAQALSFAHLDIFIAQLNVPSLVLSAFALCALFFIGHYAPELPGALIVLAFGLAFSAAFGLESQGVEVLGNMPKGFPSFTLPHVTGLGVVVMVSGAFSIAVTVAIESLLTLNTFCMSEGSRPHGDRELVSLALGNVASSAIGCPPCSASLSRTAAAKSAGGVSQIASVCGALVIAAFVLVLSPYLYTLPQPVLAAIVSYAMIKVIDFKAGRRYARNVRIELGVLVLVAVTVLVLGAVAGVAIGVAVSLITNLYRRRATGHEKLMGFDAGEPDIALSIPENVLVDYMHGFLSFTNIDRLLEAIRERITDEMDTVIFEISDVTSIAATAAETFRLFIRTLSDAGIHVRIVRSLALANDHYTRYELRRVMKRVRIYPTVEDAIEDVNSMKRKQLQIVPLDLDAEDDSSEEAE
ncbi:MAG: SulP family inorganic anion transporter [Eggerthellaceae bacterium]|nr:SulP family inorganic anion transporter [Eggerthellaceae bacterium]